MLSIGGKLVRPGLEHYFSSRLDSQKHNQCSEGFYRDQIQSDIQTTSSVTAQERLKMMDLLKQFESNTGEENLDDEDEEEDALVQRLKGIDLGMAAHSHTIFLTVVPGLDSVSPDDLWDLLPDDQRVKFIKTMENPSSELTKQLLAEGGLLHEQFTPWWKNDGDPSAKRPAMMKIPRMMVEGAQKDGPPLYYNICAVW